MRRALAACDPPPLPSPRCRCKWLTFLPTNKDKWKPAELKECAEEEMLVERLVKQGRMPFSDRGLAPPQAQAAGPQPS